MIYTLGIDIGASYSKAVVCEDGALKSWSILPSGGDYKDAALKVAETALQGIGLSMKDVSSTMSTGYGASMVDCADRTGTDISCHAAGIRYLFPSARMVIDLGAQSSRAISLDEAGRVINFVVNEKCAGGSGKFLQVMARILHMDVGDIGKLSLTSTKPVEFTTSCAVFAESEAVSRIAEGALPADILAGVHKAMASKVLNLIVRLGLKDAYAVTGGGANDAGLVKAIEKEIGAGRALVPEHPQITAALGAALLASS